ncbi:MAG TPA: trigger factor family protein, partial [Nitrospira sp.]|nr:trigger factor family protein [Nitrospira sp.]
MLVNFEDLSPVRKSIEVEIPADRIASEASRVTSEFGRQANLPGFRKGKVPANVVRSRFAKEIQEEVMSRLLPVSFQEAIAGKGL